MALVRQADTSKAERDLTRAVRRVQEIYGTNLNQFFEDARKAAAERTQESDRAAAVADDASA